jgi:seryl-tRNA synthetase
MIDISLLRDRPEELAAQLTRRGVDIDVSALAEMEARIRGLRHEADEARARQKAIGKTIAKLPAEEKQAAIAEASEFGDRNKALAAEADELQEQFDAVWVNVPNLAHDSVPDGMTEEDAVEVKQWGTPREFDFEVRDHQDLGEAMDTIDVERGVRLSGSRFAYLKGQAVILELALVRFAMDILGEAGFTPVIPPVLVREEALLGTGFFPEAREQVYAIPEDDLYLVGTSEVALGSLHAGEILDLDDLPLHYAGFSPCFRREAGTYGKDTRGIFRVHQFDKVEMFSFCHPERSWHEHELLFSLEEKIVQLLELPYRVVNVAAGDLGASAAKKYDIEAWIPGQGAYREITSCSNTTDYQSRRLRIRYRAEEGNELVHTLNGTAVAVGRTILAIMENHQQADGTVRIPEALIPYTGFDVMGA